MRVALHPEVAVSVSVNVAQSPEEAEMQEKGVDPLRLELERTAAEDAAAAAECAGEASA